MHLSSFISNLSKIFHHRKSLFRLTILSTLFFAILYFGYKNDIKSQNNNPTLSCSEITPPSNANPGVNCNWLGLPKCSTVVTPNRRVNCADIIDLPLCSDIPTPPGPVSGKNCVSECSVIGDQAGKVRGVDYAVHNRDCIRFCNSPENGVTAAQGTNCTAKKCNQLSGSDTPTPGTNCTLQKCNLLTIEELQSSTSKLEDKTKQYCDGSQVKCYDFNTQKLPYAIYREQNTMCQIHNCPPSDTTCGADDTVNITNQGTDYVNLYKQRINANVDIGAGLCKPLTCKPTMYRQYRCLGDSPNFTRHQDCDSTSSCNCNPDANANSIVPCNPGYCNKTINCNTDTTSAPECRTADPVPPENNDTDPYNSWFYRPVPPENTVNWRGELKDSEGNKIYMSDTTNICYDINDLREEPDDLTTDEDNEPDDDGNLPRFGNGWGYWTGVRGPTHLWWHTLTGGTRTPGHCDANKLGSRGRGYIYICGSRGSLYNGIGQDDGYIKGDVRTYYSDTDIEYKITACIRYKNAGQLGACGERECKINCTNSKCDSQWCGFDACREMTVKQSETDRCSMKKHGELFTDPGSSGFDCVSDTIDDYVRMRAVKYGRRLCVFVDQRGTFAYDSGKFLYGTEQLNDAANTCISGEKVTNDDGTKTCDGKDTHDNKDSAQRWRTLNMGGHNLIRYIGNNQPSTSARKGYTSIEGIFYKESECAMVPLKIGPPRFYNVATSSNSANLFGPSPYILESKVKRGGNTSQAFPPEKFGITDFYQPELKVKFGITEQLMSLSANHVGASDRNPETYATSPWTKTLSTAFNNLTYTVEVFVNKEYDATRSKPIFCLYRKIYEDSKPIDPAQIGCVERAAPEIMRINSAGKASLNFVVSPDSNNKFNNAKIKLKLITNPGEATPSYTNEITLEDPSLDSQDPRVTCSKEIEQYQFCVKREECSKLYYECANNKIAFHNARASGQPTAQYESLERECTTALLSNCNRKWGITSSGAADIFSQPQIPATNTASWYNSPDTTSQSAQDNAYGWFNEICINKGFEGKLRNVIAYKSPGAVGKCKIDANKSTSTNCSRGGRAPYCVCATAPDSYAPTAEEEVRKETPHEAGLCIDIPIPQACPAIDYTPNANTVNPNDPNFVIDSVNKTFYTSSGNPGGVDTSHRTRTTNRTNYGSAEFSSALEGMSNVEGACNGFWKFATAPSSGAEMKPKLNCTTADGWSGIQNSCERYKCTAINTLGIRSDGTYEGGYGYGESSAGNADGYATWSGLDRNAVDPASDFPLIQNATACIVGFKKRNSTPVTTGSGATARITSYQGGTSPTRACNQVGQWGAVQNSCERIVCPLNNPPENPTSDADFAAWDASAGATFYNKMDDGANLNYTGDPNLRSRPTPKAVSNSIPASRSNEVDTVTGTTKITDFKMEDSSIAVGTCNKDIGAFQLGGDRPTKECDHLGNVTLKNPCVSSCDAITKEADAKMTNNGNAYWKEAQVTIGSGQSQVAGVFTECVAGYFRNPYTLKTASASIVNPPNPPNRVCQTVTLAKDKVNVWGAVVNGCVNYCPGGADDNRIGVGVTRHNLSTIGQTDLSWPQTTLGGDAYLESCESMNAGNFVPGRTNGCYRIKRHCNGPNDTGKIPGTWETPEPMCIANGGQVGNATYRYESGNGHNNSATVSQNISLTGSCVSGFWKANRNTAAAPTRTCKYNDSNNYIDQVAFVMDKVDNIEKPDCEQITCQITSGQTFGNSVATSSTTISVGNPAYLSCKATTNETCPQNGASWSHYYYNDCANNNFWKQQFGMGIKEWCADTIMDIIGKYATFSAVPDNYTSPHNKSISRAFIALIYNSPCLKEYGKAIVGGSRDIGSNEQFVCGLTSGNTDRTTHRPTVTCNTDGTLSNVANDCSLCRGCSSSSSTVGTSSCYAQRTCADNNFYLSSILYDARHTDSASGCKEAYNIRGGSPCWSKKHYVHATMAATCRDGKWYTTQFDCTGNPDGAHMDGCP